jgi:hypothetical protein
MVSAESRPDDAPRSYAVQGLVEGDPSTSERVFGAGRNLPDGIGTLPRTRIVRRTRQRGKDYTPTEVLRRVLGPPARGIAIICAAAFVTGAPSIARAAGAVGDGTSASCTDAALNAALAGGGLVTFNCGGPATIDVSSGTATKTIAADTTIDGAGLITISGGNRVGVFSVNPGVSFTVENLTVADGHVADQFPGARAGGGIDNAGVFTVINSIFTGNRAGIGGAISSGPGSLTTVANSTFIGNDGSVDGGGISNAGTLTISDSTFTGNSAGIGGAISTGRGSLTVTNCTFAGNIAYVNGGGISSGIIRGDSVLIITNSTFTGNGAGIGAAIASIPPGLIVNTILANSRGILANSRIRDNCFGTVTDGGHNLDDGTSCGFGAANGSLSGTDPQLDPAGLQDNGGRTQTVALSATSPAIDAGDQAVCATAPVHNRDQRGYSRPGAGHTLCSIGAYEADAAAPEVCTGDCDGNGMAAIQELVLGVNIALGRKPRNACSAFASPDGMVDIAQLITGVNNALGGCNRGGDECTDEISSRDCAPGTVCTCCCGTRRCLPAGEPTICCLVACLPPLAPAP